MLAQCGGSAHIITILHRGSSKFITNYNLGSLASRTPTLCYVIYVRALLRKWLSFRPAGKRVSQLCEAWLELNIGQLYHSKKSHIQRDIGTKLDKNHCFNCYRCLPIPILRIRTHTQLQECFSVSLIQRVKEKVHLSVTDAGLVHNWRRFFQTTKNHIQSLVEIVWVMN